MNLYIELKAKFVRNLVIMCCWSWLCLGESYINLEHSTNVILQLIKKDTLHEFFENNDKKIVDNLIKNYSPAYLAFEAEVLQHDGPVLAVFLDAENKNDDASALFSYLAQKYQMLKIVEIDGKELHTIADICAVDELPAIVLIIDRSEAFRLEGKELQDISKAHLEDMIAKVITANKDDAARDI